MRTAYVGKSPPLVEMAVGIVQEYLSAYPYLSDYFGAEERNCLTAFVRFSEELVKGLWKKECDEGMLQRMINVGIRDYMDHSEGIPSELDHAMQEYLHLSLREPKSYKNFNRASALYNTYQFFSLVTKSRALNIARLAFQSSGGNKAKEAFPVRRKRFAPDVVIRQPACRFYSGRLFFCTYRDACCPKNRHLLPHPADNSTCRGHLSPTACYRRPISCHLSHLR